MRYEDDFHQIDNGTSIGGAADYEYLSGSDTFVLFQTGTDQGIVLGQNTGTGEAFVARSDEPSGLNQMAEGRFRIGTTPGSIARTGVFVLATDSNNMVYAVFDHLTKYAYLYERIAGSDTLLGTTDTDTATGATGAAVRLEVIGDRARLTFEPSHANVEDKPPTVVATLSGTYTVPGAWGMLYFSDDGADTMEIERLTLADLPSVYLPPPDLSAANASGPNLVAVTATLATIPTHPYLFEWEVLPKDADDFAEGYADLSVYNVTSRVFFVRPGFEYFVRARCWRANGTVTDWAQTSFTSTGSKPASSPTYPTLEFPDVVPSYVLSRSQTAAIDATVSDTGRERLHAKWVRPQNAWTLKFNSRDKDEIQSLMDFYQSAKSRELPFKWTHPTSGEAFVCVFDTDEPGYDVISHSDTDDPIIDLELPIVETGYNVVSNLSVTLTLDASLRP